MGLMVYALALALADSEPPAAAVVVASTVNLEEAEAASIAGRLARAVESRLGRGVTATGHALEPSCLTKRVCAEAERERLGVEVLLLITLHRLGQRISLEVSASQPAGPPRKVVQAQLSASDELEDKLGRVADVIASSLASRLPRPASPPPPAPAPPPAAAAPPAREELPKVEPPPAVSKAETPTPAPASGDKQTLDTLGVAGLSVGAALLGGGVGFGLWAVSDRDSLDADGCRLRPCDRERVESLETKVRVADVLFASAAGIAAISTVLLLIEPEPDPGEVAARPTGFEVRF